MKLLLSIATGLLLIATVSAATRGLGLSVARVDVAVAIVFFAAMRLHALEGAVTAFFCGYFLDVLSGQPTGLYAFSSVALLLVTRVLAPLVDMGSALLFAVGAGVADLLFNLLVYGLLTLTSPPEASYAAMLVGLLPTAGLTALAALPTYYVYKRIEGLFAKPHTGYLL